MTKKSDTNFLIEEYLKNGGKITRYEQGETAISDDPNTSTQYGFNNQIKKKRPTKYMRRVPKR